MITPDAPTLARRRARRGRRGADLVVTPVPTRGECRGKPVIDRFDTWRNDSYAVWLDPGRIDIESARE